VGVPTGPVVLHLERPGGGVVVRHPGAGESLGADHDVQVRVPGAADGKRRRGRKRAAEADSTGPVEDRRPGQGRDRPGGGEGLRSQETVVGGRGLAGIAGGQPQQRAVGVDDRSLPRRLLDADLRAQLPLGPQQQLHPGRREGRRQACREPGLPPGRIGDRYDRRHSRITSLVRGSSGPAASASRTRRRGPRTCRPSGRPWADPSRRRPCAPSRPSLLPSRLPCP
jgi:hypothetical protein